MPSILGLSVLETAVDTSGIDSGIADAKGKAESGGDEIAGVLNGALSGIGAAVAAGVAVVGAAVVGIGAAAFNVGNDVSAAAGDMQAALGLTAAEADRLADVAANVWGNNFTASIADASALVTEVRQQLGAMADNEMQRAAENAARLNDVFGLEYAESLNAVKALTTEFGMTTDQAFDLITSGMQSGLNSSDDFLDSIREYSNQFGDAGFSADQMFSIMQSGLEAGVLGTDKISDSIKEMVIKLNEGSDDTKAAFDTIGLSFDDIAASVAAGDETWADYFDEIVAGINSIEDPIERQKAQVAIFGTMAEDLGVSFTEGLGAATTALEDMEGATAGLDVTYNTLGDAMEGFKRQALLALEPIGEILLDLANRAMPLVQSAFDWFSTTLVPIIESAAESVGNFIDTLTGGLDTGSASIESFRDTLIDLAGNAIEFVIEKLGEFAEMVGPVLADAWRAFVDWFGDQDWAQLGSDAANLILDGLRQFADMVGPILADWAAAFWAWVQSVDWPAVATAILNGIAAGLAAFADFVGGILSTWGPVFWAWAQSVDWIGLAADILGAIADGLANFATWIAPILADWFNAFLSWVASVDWYGLAYTIVTGIIDGLRTFASWIGPILADWAAAFWSWVQSVDWGSIASGIITGIVNGLYAGVAAVGAAAAQVARGALQAAKDALGIGSPSTEFIEIGKNVIEGLAIGLRGNAGMATDAIEFVVDEIETGAINDLTAMIMAISNAIGPAIAALYQLARFEIPAAIKTKIEEFNDVLFWLVRSIAVMAWNLEGSRKMTLRMAEIIIEIAAAVSVSIAALNDLDRNDIPAGLDAKYDALAGEIARLVGVFADLAGTIESQLLNQIEAFVDAAAAVADLIEPIIDASARLAAVDWDRVVAGPYGHLRDQIIIFRKIVHTLVREFAAAAILVGSDLSATIAAFADAAAAVVGLVEDTIDAAAALAAVDWHALVAGPYGHLADQIVIFRKVIATLAREFGIAADDMGSMLADHVRSFTDAAAAVVGLVADGVQAAADLAAVDWHALVAGPYGHLRDQIIIFRKVIDTLVREFAGVAAAISDELAAQIKRFSDSAGALIKIVKPGIEALQLLSDYIMAADLQAGVDAFSADMIAAIESMVTAFEQSALWASDALEAAADMAGYMQDLIGVVKPGIEAIELLAAYIAASDITDKTKDFTDDLKDMAIELVRGLEKVAEDIGTEALQAAISIAEDLNTLTATIADILADMETIANAKIADLRPNLEYLVKQAELIAWSMTSASATVNGTIVQAARAFAANVAIVVTQVLDALRSLDRLVNANIPGSLQSILNAMMAAINSKIGPMRQAGEALGQALANGLSGKLQAAVDAARQMAAAVANAARAALQISSPSKVFEEIGEGIGSGLALGIANNSIAAEMAIGGLAGNLIGATATAPASNTYYQFEMTGGYGMSLDQQIDALIDAALLKRGIRADYRRRT